MLAAISTLLLASTFVIGTPAPARMRAASVVPLPARASSASPKTNKVFNKDLFQEEISRLKLKYGNENLKGSNTPAKRSHIAPLPHTKPLDIAPLPHRKHDRGGGSSGEDALTDDPQGGVDILYYSPISVGTPPQQTTVEIDTGSSDLWFPLASCDDGCPGPLFNSNQSSTYQDSGIRFFTGSEVDSYATGTVANDTVSVAGLTVAGQGFGAVTHTGGNFLTSPSAGVLGLGFPFDSKSGTTPFFINLVESGALASPVFSLYLARGGADGSELCIGCTDSSKFTGDITYYPLDSDLFGPQALWNVQSGGFSYNNGRSSGTFSAVIDSGTTLIYVPPDAADAFYANIPGAQAVGNYNGTYNYPCNATLGTIAIAFGTETYELSADDFNAGASDEGSDQCIGAIIGLELGYPELAAIIGDAFLKNVYSVFDYGNSAVGFAKAI